MKIAATKKHRIIGLKVDHIAACVEGMQEGAKALILKSRDHEAQVKKRAALTTVEDEHTHLIVLDSWDGGASTRGQTSFDDGHQHPWILKADDSIVLGEVQGHTHEIAEISKRRFSAKDRADATKSLSSTSTDGSKDADDGEKCGDDSMGGTNTEDVAKKLDKAESEKVDLAKKLDLAQRENALSNDERAFFKALPTAAQAAFLALDAPARGVEVAKAKDSDPVVFKSRSGREFRKSADPALLDMARQHDDMALALEKSNAERTEEIYKSRVRAELPHLPGDETVRVALLKAVDGIADAGVRKLALEAMKAGDRAMVDASFFKSRGTTAGGVEPGSPDDELERLAKSRAEQDKVSIDEGMERVLKTAEGARIYELRQTPINRTG